MSGQLLSERRGSVLLLTINNPAARNALEPASYQPGALAVREAGTDDGIGAIVLTGAGGYFSSGGNLSLIASLREGDRSAAEEGIAGLQDWILALRTCPKPVIAAVEGTAAGAGFSLALACDLLVAARETRFLAAHVKVGISPDGGITSALARALPPQMQAELLLEGKPVDAETLARFGIVNRLCAPGETLAAALEWGEQLAAGPRQAMSRIKQLLDAAYHNDIAAQLDLEQRLTVDGIFHDECGEGIAAFFERRRPIFGAGGTQ